MAYAIHIERRHDNQLQPIDLEDWLDAVQATQDVRPSGKDIVTTAPRTNEAIRMQGHSGDAEVFFPADQTWRPVFMWSRRGKVIFSVDKDFERHDDPLRTIARALARRLNATIIGDNGETYD